MIKNIVKLFVLLILMQSCNRGNADKKAVFASLEKGEAISKLIKDSNTEKLKKVFVNIPNIEYLLEIVEDDIIRHEQYELSQPNIFYNPYGDEYIYTVYANKWIDNNTEWGLSDYLFVLQLAFTYDDSSNKVTAVKQRILKDHVGFKKWWYSFMRSYTEKTCRRDEWADMYGLVPPPPPPPATEDW
ncbi:hypothetical protein [Aquimarina sp. 2201CG14-23]|uniref:hypothetical protein n=1 Tax=Aquimarina mycalae TaxID=3040073 RepID=UPI002477D2B7|nr:hypothetical protein [Aquimarina sp. 2201CG14-23]MDH7445625.1 hypothetical protein [Aquimarina sp. 2201CG14-23]